MKHSLNNEERAPQPRGNDDSTNNDSEIDPRIYCKLGHLNLLIENYGKGWFSEFHKNLRASGNILTKDEYFAPAALSAYQKYRHHDPEHWKASSSSI